MRQSDVDRRSAAIPAGLDVKADRLTVYKTTQFCALHGSDVHENVLPATFWNNQPVEFGLIAPLYGALGHRELCCLFAAREIAAARPRQLWIECCGILWWQTLVAYFGGRQVDRDNVAIRDMAAKRAPKPRKILMRPCPHLRPGSRRSDPSRSGVGDAGGLPRLRKPCRRGFRPGARRGSHRDTCRSACENARQPSAWHGMAATLAGNSSASSCDCGSWVSPS